MLTVALPCLRLPKSAFTFFPVSPPSCRRYSTPSSARLDQISIPCRSNGDITLNLFHPLRASGPSPSVILYLPPGPVLPAAPPAVDVAAALSSVTSATVVQINYRLSRNHQFPTPIHDVLTGYDWVLEHLLPNRRPGRSVGHAVKIAVCGELIGGSLASMLALTECRFKGPCVAAAAVNEPIVDWAFPEVQDAESDSAVDRLSSFIQNLAPKRRPNRPKTPRQSFIEFAENGIIDTALLLRARRDLFRKPEDYFDTFASPLFNLRTPGVAVPPAAPVNVLDEFEEIALLEEQDFHRQQLRLGAISRKTSDLEVREGVASTKKPRKSNRTWPAAGSGLRIPSFRISAAEASPLSDQAFEFANQLQKNVVMQELKTTAAEDNDESREAAYMFAEHHIRLQTPDSIRLWSLGQTHDLRHIAHWFEQIIG